MPSINIGEDDFTAVAMAAMNAKSEGDMGQARALDKVARKINAALTAQTTRPFAYLTGSRRPVRWQDMPSTIGEATP